MKKKIVATLFTLNAAFAPLQVLAAGPDACHVVDGDKLICSNETKNAILTCNVARDPDGARLVRTGKFNSVVFMKAGEQAVIARDTAGEFMEKRKDGKVLAAERRVKGDTFDGRPRLEALVKMSDDMCDQKIRAYNQKHQPAVSPMF